MSINQAQHGGRPRATAPVHERLGLHRDARDTLDARRRAHGNERKEASHGYHPRRGGRYDSGMDQSPSLDLPGPQAFGQHNLNAFFPPRCLPSTNIPKYSRETNPELWLKDYRLAC